MAPRKDVAPNSCIYDAKLSLFFFTKICVAKAKTKRKKDQQVHYAVINQARGDAL